MTNIYETARAYAQKKHEGQFRFGPQQIPYFTHVEDVALRLQKANCDDLTIAIGFLHDTLEDTDSTYEELVDLFGTIVADDVMSLTCDPNLTAKEQKAQQIIKMPSLSFRARCVKIADRTSNINDLVVNPPSWKLSRKLWYVEQGRLLIDASRGTHDALEATWDEIYEMVLSNLK